VKDIIIATIEAITLVTLVISLVIHTESLLRVIIMEALMQEHLLVGTLYLLRALIHIALKAETFPPILAIPVRPTIIIWAPVILRMVIAALRLALTMHTILLAQQVFSMVIMLFYRVLMQIKL
jgi:hypothetical protein